MSLPPSAPSDLRDNSLNFLRTELGLAATFIDTARMPHNDSAINARNRQNARKAYDAILHFLPGFSLNAGEQNEFDHGLAALKADLIELGEVFA